MYGVIRRVKNSTDDQFWSRTGRAIIFWCFLGRQFLKKNIGEKLDGRQIFARKTGRVAKIFLVDGRDRNIARPFIREGCNNFPPKNFVHFLKSRP